MTLRLIIGAIFGPMGLAAKTEWITFLAGTGAIVLPTSLVLDSIRQSSEWNGKKQPSLGLWASSGQTDVRGASQLELG